MKELVVISGKGGTGKTSVLASFAALAGKAVLADCDVDAADLHLLLKQEETIAEDFISGRKALIDKERCTACGECFRLCRFDAVIERDSGKDYYIDELLCEGCGLCRLVCPAGAVFFEEDTCGQIFTSRTKYGSMIHARLNPGAGNSGKLVTQVKAKARAAARENKLDLMLIDGPPGTGCPVIATISDASLVLVVTEPSLSGIHDLERILELTKHFGIDAIVCINKWDINAKNTDMIKKMIDSMGVALAGCIPYDSDFTRAQILATPVVACSNGYAAGQIKRIWGKVCQMMDL